MKKIPMTVTACLLALMITVLSPLTVFANGAGNTEDTQNNGKYISELRIGMGTDAASAADSLEGYIILSDNGVKVDLNQKAGGGWGSKGEKVVYLGYKTTDDETEAITDLAVMNMKGGYSVFDYNMLYDNYIASQIKPLVKRLMAAINEYRVNYSSENENNRKRAQYIHDALDKLIDDDCEKGLGTLLLNQTRYEMGEYDYRMLASWEKKNVADIVEILTQANGKATLLLESLLARAADTSDDTWIDRLSAVTYEDLLDELCDYEGMLPSDAKYELTRRYDDDAKKISTMWNQFRAVLTGRDAAQDIIDNYDSQAVQQEIAELKELIEELSAIEDPSDEQREALEKAYADWRKAQDKISEAVSAMKTIAVYSYLEQIEYGDGTLVSFFLRPLNEVNITELYPIAASLSDGQKVGLDFLSLLEMVTIAMTDGDSYSDEDLDQVPESSIYEGVDRGIYERGVVALTNEAVRARALEDETGIPGMTASRITLTSYWLTGIYFGAFALTTAHAIWFGANNVTSLNELKKQLRSDRLDLTMKIDEITDIKFEDDKVVRIVKAGHQNEYDQWTEQIGEIDKKLSDPDLANEVQNPASKYVAVGIGLAVALMLVWSIYSTYHDLVEYYNVEYTPIPLYIVEEKDITAYDAEGKKIFIKNQAAYYKCVKCNRKKGDEMYKSVGTEGDLNGDVGAQWLALYSVKQEQSAPILAGSLKAVVGSSDLPADYTTGIHMFGSASAFDLNNHMYVWNGEAPSVYVYYNVDTAAKRSAAGSLFAEGKTAIAGALGAVVGALATVLFMSQRKKKKEEENAA